MKAEAEDDHSKGQGEDSVGAGGCAGVCPVVGLRKGDQDLVHFVHIAGQNKITEQRPQGLVDIASFKIEVCNEKLEDFEILFLTQILPELMPIHIVILKENVDVLR
jgi:hypothetical protein